MMANVQLPLSPSSDTPSLTNFKNKVYLVNSRAQQKMTNRSGEVKIISRNKWGSQPFQEGVTFEPISHPVENVIFSYDSETNQCFDKGQCINEIRELQAKYIRKGCFDIPYNFVVGGDGFVYEGRGWDKKPEKHAKFANVHNSSIEVAFFGDYRTTGIRYDWVEAGHRLVEYGVKSNYIDKNYKLLEATPRHYSDQ